MIQIYVQLKQDTEAEAVKEVSNEDEEHLREENIEHNKGIMINIKQLIDENKLDIETIKDQIKLKVELHTVAFITFTW